MKSSTFAAVVLGSAMGLAAPAATPPPFVNYQGVLRSVSDAPLTGSYDMVFTFYSQASGGDQIVIDTHAAAGTGAVGVTGGLFNAALGAGALTDGLGPNTYTSLADVFRDYGTVWLEVSVNSETLTPRVRVLASAYAMNASSLEGRPAGSFLDTSAAAQTKGGPATFDASSAPGNPGLTAKGVNDSYGTGSAGYFINNSTGAEGRAGTGAFGIEGRGPTAGGFFTATVFPGGTGTAYVGSLNGGVEAYGSYGGYFVGSSGAGGGEAYVGDGSFGITATGPTGGGFFRDNNDGGYAYVGFGSAGIEAYGYGKGGFFKDNVAPNNYAYVASGMYKIVGTGTPAFVQNHPTDADKVIVYACPEGDEVATYTRGTGKLAKGEARVRLGETFQWVTNPDIGLTAQVTPRGSLIPLSVESVSTRELLVKGPAGSDASFDYVVYGLRIGFEEISIVQERQRDAPTPSFAEHMARYQLHPELRKYDALERFRAMRAESGDESPVDLTAAKALYTAINAETNHAAHSAGPPTPLSPSEAETLGPRRPHDAPEPAATPAVRSSSANASPAITTGRPADTAPLRPLNVVRVSEVVEAGDVLVVDRERPGVMRLGSLAGDPTLVGIVVAGDPSSRLDPLEAPTALAGTVVPCKVDATSGAIRVGDLLTVSSTPGHAMRSIDPIPGTILGKALEEMETGTGVIRILVMFR